jgi:hypothetical protein
MLDYKLSTKENFKVKHGLVLWACMRYNSTLVTLVIILLSCTPPCLTMAVSVAVQHSGQPKQLGPGVNDGDVKKAITLVR